MSISSDLTRIKNAKSAIITSITNKGVTVPSGTKIDGLAALINKIPTGATRQTPASLGYANKAYVCAFDGQYPYGGYAKPSSAADVNGVMDMVNGMTLSASSPCSSGANYFSTIKKSGSTTYKSEYFGYCGLSGYALTRNGFTIEITFSYVDSIVNNTNNNIWLLTFKGKTTNTEKIYTNGSYLRFEYYDYGDHIINIMPTSELKVGSKYCVQIRNVSGTGFHIYVNGVLKYSTTATLSITGYYGVISQFTLGYYNTTSYNYYSFRVFEGGLTNAELTQNYNRDKARFGIT